MKKIIHVIYVMVGFISLGIGSLGIVLPILPSAPFFLLSLLLFAKGSDRFHQWFLSTRLYKKYLEDVVVTKSMTMVSKIKILSAVTLLMGVGIYFSPVYAKVILVIVAMLHYVYFLFGIKTSVKENTDSGQKQMMDCDP